MKDRIKLLELFYADDKERKEAIEVLKRLEKQEERFSKEELLAYAKKIKPVMRGRENAVHLFATSQEQDLFWIPATPIKTQSFSFSNSKTVAKAVGLKEIARVKTYHRYGEYSMFLRPSVDEAIWQCPEDIIDKVCAFEVVPKVNSASFLYDKILDLHVLETIYYEGVLPEEVANQEIMW